MATRASIAGTFPRPYHNVRSRPRTRRSRESMASHHDFTLEAKYRLEEGTIFLSGIQALVRLPLDQHRADTRRRVRTATLILGYRGSPLGGRAPTLERNPQPVAETYFVFTSGLNADL